MEHIWVILVKELFWFFIYLQINLTLLVLLPSAFFVIPPMALSQWSFWYSYKSEEPNFI